MSATPFFLSAAVAAILAALTFLGWLALAGAADDDCASRASGPSAAESAS